MSNNYLSCLLVLVSIIIGIGRRYSSKLFDGFVVIRWLCSYFVRYLKIIKLLSAALSIQFGII